MKTKSKKLEEKLKLFILANIFFFFLFMLINDEEVRMTLLNISFSLLFLSCSLFYFRNSYKKLGLNTKNFAKATVFGIFAFISILFFTIFVEAILDFFGINASTGIEKILSQNFVLILSAVFVSPLCEEMFFRATLIDFFDRSLKNINFSIILSAIVFSIFHIGYGSPLELFGAFVAGIILGFVYKKSKTLLAPILAHFLYNFLSISLLILNF
jgi:membrane protease YdiL (CAAX protease family)